MKLMLTLVAAVAVALSAGAHTVAASDEVTSMPGYGLRLPSRMFSGYLDVAGGKHLHYFLVEAESNPATAPVTFWFNGGPGCSSMDGYFYEQGPLHVVEPYPTNGTMPSLYLNPHRWSKIANMVFLESPACVGFSYADTSEGCVNSDTQQAVDSLNAVLRFRQMYPQYNANDFFVTGESYGGMYVPTLALNILKHNKQVTLESDRINLQGIMVGNGVIGAAEQNSAKIYTDFYHGKGLISDDVYQTAVAACGGLMFPDHKLSLCQNAVTDAHNQIGNVNTYDINTPCVDAGFPPTPGVLEAWKRPPTKVEQAAAMRRAAKVDGIDPGPTPCIDAGAATAYLNMREVRQAMHVKSAAEIGKWQICTEKLDYTGDFGSLLPYYKQQLIPNIRVTIYNGDVDGCVPFTGNQAWTSGLGVPLKTPWSPWSVDGQVAGYVTEYESNFNFVTVKGSGHMVPQYRPKQALAMFSRFINNQPYASQQ